MNRKEREFIESCDHGIACVDTTTGKIVHFVGYDHVPTREDAEELYQELKDDVSLGLCGVVDRLKFVHAPVELVEGVKRDMLAKSDSEASPKLRGHWFTP